MFFGQITRGGRCIFCSEKMKPGTSRCPKGHRNRPN